MTIRDARVEKGHGQQRQNGEQDLEPGEGPGLLPAKCLCVYLGCRLRAARPRGEWASWLESNIVFASVPRLCHCFLEG